MKPLSRDTPPDFERRWLEGLRARGPSEGLRRTVELTHFCWLSARRAYERTHPGATPRDRDAWWLREAYGEEIASKVLEHCDRTGWYDR